MSVSTTPRCVMCNQVMREGSHAARSMMTSLRHHCDFIISGGATFLPKQQKLPASIVRKTQSKIF